MFEIKKYLCRENRVRDQKNICVEKIGCRENRFEIKKYLCRENRVRDLKIFV